MVNLRIYTIQLCVGKSLKNKIYIITIFIQLNLINPCLPIKVSWEPACLIPISFFKMVVMFIYNKMLSKYSLPIIVALVYKPKNLPSTISYSKKVQYHYYGETTVYKYNIF